MRVVTWNLQHGVPDPKGPPDLPRSFEPLRDLAGDVHACQELDQGLARTRRAHQGTELSEALGGELLWAPAITRRGGSFGNALVVRGEVLSFELLPLPDGRIPRSAGIARVLVGDREWSLATAHLSLRNASAQAQLLAVFDALAALPPPRMVLGDLNLVPRLVLPYSTAEGYRLVDGPPTCNARKRPTRRLDHILVQGARVERAGVRKMPLSDHLAVWADLA